MIINKMAEIVNNFIVDLYSKNIHFYQIIIGLFIFNFLVYIIRNMVKNIRLGRLY